MICTFLPSFIFTEQSGWHHRQLGHMGSVIRGFAWPA